MRTLSLTDAVACHERLTMPLRPATLHPAYVEADAARNRMLQPIYLHYQRGADQWMHCVHLAMVPGTDWCDVSSPYGYGGPLCISSTPSFLAQAWSSYCEWMRSHRVVVEYVRFHPLLANQRHYGGSVLHNRSVVSVDLTVPDLWGGYAPRLRTTLNKAKRAGLVYEETLLTPGCALLPVWGQYYRAAMLAMGADLFFAFEDAYFERLVETGLARLGVCRQVDETGGSWLAACLLLEGLGVTEYHLAATCQAGRRWGASSFVLHNAALMARERGQRQLYLGGGSNVRPDNPLYFFKTSFSEQRLNYCTGFEVFNSDGYGQLQQLFARERAAHPDRPIFYRKV